MFWSLLEWLLKSLAHISLMCLHKLTYPIVWYLYESEHEKILPPITSRLLMKPAVELSRMIRNKEVSALEVMQVFVKRIREVNGILNAAVDCRFEEALATARKVDELLSNGHAPVDQPFLGIPFTAKEAFAIIGFNNTSGLLSRVGTKATFDADVVANLRAAGAIPVAVSNCSELCMWSESSNLVYGRTNNAYHAGRMVGGSTGGEGSLLSGAASVVGVGSDVGGSIRMPAFFNGVFGHKPTSGIVSNDGQFPKGKSMVEDYLVTGPLCRYAADLTPMMKIMAEPKGLKKLHLDAKVDVSKLHCYYMVDDGGSFLLTPVDQQIKDSIMKAVEHFESLGASVQSVNLSELRDSFEIWSCFMSTSGDDPFASLMANGKDISLLSEFGKWLIREGRHTLPAIGLGIMEQVEFSPSQIRDFEQKVESLKRQFQELLSNEGFFLYPTHPQLAYYHHHNLSVPFNFAYTGVFNILGLPITQVPMGLTREGLPTGMQVVSNYYQDHISIAVAQELERAFGGWVPPSLLKFE